MAPFYSTIDSTETPRYLICESDLYVNSCCC